MGDPATGPWHQYLRTRSSLARQPSTAQEGEVRRNASTPRRSNSASTSKTGDSSFPHEGRMELRCVYHLPSAKNQKNFPLQVLRARGVPRLRRKRASNRHAWQWQRPFGGAASKAWKRLTCARKSSCNPPLRTCRRDMDLPAIMFGLQGFALAHGLCPGAELRTTGPGVSTPFHVP